MTPSSSLRERVLADAAAHRARTRDEGRRRAALLYAAAALAGLPLFFAWGGFGHAAGRPVAFTVAIATGALLLAVACGAIGWRRGRSLVGKPAAALASIAGAAPIVTYAWLVSWHARYADPFQRFGYRCLAMSIVSGAALLGAALLVRRRTVPVHASVAGAALGASTGTLAGVLVDVWCPLAAPAHVLVGHVLPIALLTVAGAIAGRFVLAIRLR